MPLQFKGMPSLFEGMRMWSCRTQKYTFVISEEGGRFTASAKALDNPTRIDLGGHNAHDSFDSAQQVCVDLMYPH